MADMSRRRHPDEPPLTWDGLTKEVRRLEQQFDHRQQALRDVINSPNLDVIDSAQTEVESILRDLSHAQSEMSHIVSNQHPAPAAHHAALARHRDTLQTMNDDFRRLRSIVKQRRDKEALLPSIRNALDSGRTTTAHSELAREAQHLSRAQTTATSMIELGNAVANKISRQGAMFGDMSGRVRLTHV